MDATSAGASGSGLRQLLSILAMPFRWAEGRLAERRRSRRLRLLETLGLGANRFVAVVQVGQQEFLVGGAGNSVVLLAELPGEHPPEVLAGKRHEAERPSEVCA